MRALFLIALAAVASGQVKQFKNPDNLGPDMPTPQTVVDEMLKVARVQPGEMVYDLGCGDGRIMITAAEKYNARAVGIEMDRDIYDKTVERVKEKGLQDRVHVINENALHANLAEADVVTLYFLTSSNERLKPILATMHPGARVVSHDYEIKGWKPINTSKVTYLGTVHTVYVYRIKGRS
jgi:precorrin-6B methylase 2